MSEFRTIGVIAKPKDRRAAATLKQVITLLLQKRHAGRLNDILISEENADAHSIIQNDVQWVSPNTLAERCEIVIVIGGDGTLLSAARCLAGNHVPILGINQGRLGFLVEIAPDQMEEAISAAIEGRCKAEDRLILSTQIRRADGQITKPRLAINDVVIRNLGSIRMLEFETWLADEFISRHRADGLIVSTPTGSTAYALSSGGPIIYPDVSALSLVPICPHTLTDRPVVVPSTQVIRIIPKSKSSDGATITCDGQIGMPVYVDDTVEITPLPNLLRLLHTHDYSYFGVLRDKLLWGRGAGFDVNRN